MKPPSSNKRRTRHQEINHKHAIVANVRGVGWVDVLMSLRGVRRRGNHQPKQEDHSNQPTTPGKRRTRLNGLADTLAPPLTITADETDNLTNIIDETLWAVETRLGV